MENLRGTIGSDILLSAMKKTKPSAARILILFKQLTWSQKLKVISKLESETRQKKWDQLTERLSQRIKNNPVSDEEITRIVEEVRQERYERSHSRS